MQNRQNTNLPQMASMYPSENYTSPGSAKKRNLDLLRFKYSAGAGLLMGILLGFFVLSGGDASDAVASNNGKENDALSDSLEKEMDTKVAASEVPTSVEKETLKESAKGVLDEEIIPPSKEQVAKQGESPAEIGHSVASVHDPDSGSDPIPTNPTVATLHFLVDPPEIADSILIEVNGNTVASDLFEIELEDSKSKQRVYIVATAQGYKKFQTSLMVGTDRKIPVTMRKKSPARKAALKKTGFRGNAKRSKSSKSKRKRPGGLLSL